VRIHGCPLRAPVGARASVRLVWPHARPWCASLLLLASSTCSPPRPAAGPFLVGLPLAPFCREQPCPRDYDDAVAHAFAGQPGQGVYPACRGARVVAFFTSDTGKAWFFDGASGELIGEAESSWGSNARYGRVVSLEDCKPRVEPKHFTWHTDERLARACEPLRSADGVPPGAPDTYRFQKDGPPGGAWGTPVSVCVVATTDGRFLTGDGRSFRALSLPEWSALLRALEDAHLDSPPPQDPPQPQVGEPPPDAAAITWQVDTVVSGKRTTVVRHGATVDHYFRRAVRAFTELVSP
jgi:hypothetical protein